MHNPACQRTPPCSLDGASDPYSLVKVLAWDGPAAGRKAVTFAGGERKGHIYLDSRFWDELPSFQGRQAIFLHEVGHLAGARCEPCADFYAGHALRRLGANNARDARRALIGKLENRSPEAADQNLARGFGADLPADPLAGKQRQTVEGWEAGSKLPALAVVDVGNGQWAEEDTARALALAVLAFGKSVTVNSGWRSNAKQTELYEGFKAGKPGFNPADPPGFSKHQNGKALDLAFATTADREAFATLAQSYGFSRPVKGEPWHFVFGTAAPTQYVPVPEVAPPPSGVPLWAVGAALVAIIIIGGGK